MSTNTHKMWHPKAVMTPEPERWEGLTSEFNSQNELYYQFQCLNVTIMGLCMFQKTTLRTKLGTKHVQKEGPNLNVKWQTCSEETYQVQMCLLETFVQC